MAVEKHTSQPSNKKTHAQRKAAQRKKKRAEGYIEISVWVRPDKADEVRQFADSLPKPTPKTHPGQSQMFDILESNKQCPDSPVS